MIMNGKDIALKMFLKNGIGQYYTLTMKSIKYEPNFPLNVKWSFRSTKVEFRFPPALQHTST